MNAAVKQRDMLLSQIQKREDLARPFPRSAHFIAPT